MCVPSDYDSPMHPFLLAALAAMTALLLTLIAPERRHVRAQGEALWLPSWWQRDRVQQRMPPRFCHQRPCGR